MGGCRAHHQRCKLVGHLHYKAAEAFLSPFLTCSSNVLMMRCWELTPRRGRRRRRTRGSKGWTREQPQHQQWPSSSQFPRVKMVLMLRKMALTKGSSPV
jgi:hypothetical protein